MECNAVMIIMADCVSAHVEETQRMQGVDESGTHLLIAI